MRLAAILSSMMVFLMLGTWGVAWSDYDGVLSELFFGREPIARAQALGRGYVAIDDDGIAGFYNPASLAAFGALSGCYSRSERYYSLENAAFTFAYATVPLGKFGSIGFGEYHFDYGFKVPEGYTPASSEVSVAYSSRVVRNLFVGASLERVHQRLTKKGSSAYVADMGLLWRFRSLNRALLHQRAVLGASIHNIGGSALDFDGYESDLPVILRAGAQYSVSRSSRSGSSSLEPLSVLAHAEYMDVLNSSFYGGLRIGTEIRVLEVLAFRAGYYDEALDDNGIQSNRSSTSQVTYGIGVEVPSRKISDRIPITARFDLVSLHEPSLVKHAPPTHRYWLYTFALQWPRCGGGS